VEVLLGRLSSSKDAQQVRRRLFAKAQRRFGRRRYARRGVVLERQVSGSWPIENRERRYANLRSRCNLDNDVPDAVVDSLLNGVRFAGVELCRRYYTLKRQMLQQTQGLATFRWLDRNAPIDIFEDMEDKIGWDHVVAMVERGYRKFSPPDGRFVHGHGQREAHRRPRRGRQEGRRVLLGCRAGDRSIRAVESRQHKERHRDAGARERTLLSRRSGVRARVFCSTIHRCRWRRRRAF